MTQSIKGYIETVSKETDVTFSIFRTVGSIGKLRSGDNLNKSELSENGEYAVYGGNGTIGRYDKPNRSGNTIIIGKVGLYCGNVHFSKEPFWLTSNAVSLEITDESNVFVPYLVHLLKSLDLNKLATGAVQKFISIKQMNNIKLSLPTYEKQVELSKWFDDLEKSKTSIQKLLSSFSEELGVMTKNSIAEKALKH
nr:restriction endonuclease subunit S [Alteromonas sp. MCA-1]